MLMKGWRHFAKNMTYRIIETDTFQRDLNAVIRYIMLSLEDKHAATLVDAVKERLDSVRQTDAIYVPSMSRPALVRAGLPESGDPQICDGLQRRRK